MPRAYTTRAKSAKRGNTHKDGQDVQDGLGGRSARVGQQSPWRASLLGMGTPTSGRSEGFAGKILLISAHRPRFTSGIGPPGEPSDCSLLLIRCSFPVHFCSLLLTTAHRSRGRLRRWLCGAVPPRQPAYAVGAVPRKGRVSQIRGSTWMHRMDRMRPPATAFAAGGVGTAEYPRMQGLSVEEMLRHGERSRLPPEDLRSLGRYTQDKMLMLRGGLYSRANHFLSADVDVSSTNRTPRALVSCRRQIGASHIRLEAR